MRLIIATLWLCITILNLQAQNEIFINSKPGLSPDGHTVYFSFEGDIWKVSSDGGVAERITALIGEEINPRVSPDGKWLAFSSNQYGNFDVFVMSLEGGTIQQLTYHTGKDEMENWCWDSNTVLFTSDRSNGFASYSVKISGDTPVRLFKNYFNTTVGITQSPDGSYIFTNSSEGAWQLYRKYYKGENNSDLLAYNPKNKTYKQFTNYLGEDFHPSTDINGNIYFVSDEENGEYNLYRIQQNQKQALTHFDASIKHPFVAAQGNKVVFVKDYQIYIYDVHTNQSKPISIKIAKNQLLSKAKHYDTNGEISYFDISPDGKKIAFISRGIIFVSDIKGKFTRQITDGAERAMEVKWLKDNKTILYNQTWKGYQNWFSMVADGKSQPKQHTSELRNNRDITINAAYTGAVYHSGRDEVRILDLEQMTSKTIVQDEIWAFQNSMPSFSPDDNYVLFSARRNFEKDIFIHDIKHNKTMNLTHTDISENDPVWSPDGKYIYFSSDRTSPSYPLGNQQSNIFRMALDWFDQPYKSSEFDKLFSEEAEAKDAKSDTSSDKTADKKKAAIDISINPVGMLERIERITDRYGFQFDPQVFATNDKTLMFFNTRQNSDTVQLYRTVFEQFEKPATTRIFSKRADLFVQNKKDIYFLSNNHLYKLEGEKTQADKIQIQYNFEKNLNDEFQQMFYETWAGVEENFYDEQFHGKNWVAIKNKYAAFLPGITNRSDLRTLLNDMLGELNASHLGFNSSGNEESKPLSYITHETGILFKEDNPYIVDKILRKSPAYLKNIDIKPGDKLISVNGKKTTKQTNRYALFTTPRFMSEMILEFERKGQIIKTLIHPYDMGTHKALLYDDWIYSNRQRVDEWSNNTIAYVYMKNMGLGSLDQFLLDMVEQESKKEGLILDLRYNTGGNVHDKVLNFLAQRPYLQWKYREGAFTLQPNFAPASKPIVLLINQYSLSDAEVTAAGFKALNLGKVIGTETYRWIIFTSAKRLVDGSSYRLPSWGVYTLDGTDLEKTGVKPDIYIKNTFKDLLEDQDPQLKGAVEEILMQMKH